MMESLLVVCGATASGKSACAIRLAEMIGGEVVSCDSMQLYRGMDVGTAKPTSEETRGIPHHLLSVLDPNDAFSASMYREMAIPVIEDIIARGKTPILCGGTGLYIDALTRPLGFSVKSDPALHDKNMALAQTQSGKHALFERLCAVDPETAQKLHPNDVRRVSRALEIFDLTGVPKSVQTRLDREKQGDYRGVLFALSWPREMLYGRIDRRVDEMMENGLPDEVRRLVDAGVREDATSMQAIGYKEWRIYLDGRMTREDAVEAIKQGTRRYAKRQLTWFGRDERVHWIDAQGKSADDISREIWKGYQDATNGCETPFSGQ